MDDEPPIGVSHPLHPNKYTTQQNRTLYDRWYAYNQQQYCSPGIIVNPDLAIVATSVPTLYGEVESSHRSDATTLDKLHQVSARILCYTDKCFSVYTKSDIIHIKFYQWDDNNGIVHVLKMHYSHLPILTNVNPHQKALQHVVYGVPQRNALIDGLDGILLDIVKIVLFMENRAANIYMESNLHDQFLVQPDMHFHHALSAGQFSTPTGVYNAAIGNGPPLSYVDMWKWDNMCQ